MQTDSYKRVNEQNQAPFVAPGPSNDLGTSSEMNQVSSKDNRYFVRCLSFYTFLQYVILFGSLGILVALRIYYNYFILEIESDWPHNRECFNGFTMLTGIMYAVSTMGIVEFFLFKEAVKKISNETMCIRAYLKLTIELASIIYLLVDVVLVIGFNYFSDCKPEAGKQTDPVIDRQRQVNARKIMFWALLPYMANLFSFCLYLWMRRKLLRNEKLKNQFDFQLSRRY